ncbi:antibiotic biosynthesis monooxygenase [Aliiglaciecola sp. LCG003]|uniref:antibiotic biosynthesis monooxygenase family protein n=1 Tax=Aliiglaciecola sp. LCG003 TaxID=3053655 RepID=UPI002572A504|nr:antibiotic biosynthesis monooxygenase [Aliiglaciecola sp. LCG003]WJG11223.1 antibiotic biosynthesis monooxygenase [Aliiglaciecola sp. LCG003]
MTQLVDMAQTPQPPYYAVIFTSILANDSEEYAETSEQMLTLASQMDGYLGIDSARQEVGISVSYWRDIESIRAWKANTEHQKAQQSGKHNWYKSYQVRIAKVEKHYSF